jgi:WD40 repeat protein
MKLRILFAGLICGVALLAADTGAELFQKAVTQEQAAGNLEEAIKLYQQVAKDYASNRALAAKALLQAARCYDKLGEDKATKIYEQVARDFSDQTESANAARARLAALRQKAAPVTMTQRKIEPLSNDPFSYYTDGQRAVWRDAAANTLTIGDLDGRNKRVVFKGKPGESFAFQPSRDLSMVWLRVVAAGGKVTHAVIRMDGTGYRELFQGYPYGGAPPEWSWDNHYLLFYGVPPGPTEGGPAANTESDDIPIGGGVVAVSVSDGKSREVLRRDSSVRRAAFSPDGRFVAFSEGPGGPPVAKKTFLTPFQGGEPRLVSDDASLLDWTPDGRYLAVSSQSAGPDALYLLPVKDGHPSGDPVFVRYNSFAVGHTNPNGSLVYVSLNSGGAAAVLATIGSQGRLGAWRPLDVDISGNGFIGGLLWSSDSTQIV